MSTIRWSQNLADMARHSEARLCEVVSNSKKQKMGKNQEKKEKGNEETFATTACEEKEKLPEEELKTEANIIGRMQLYQR